MRHVAVVGMMGAGKTTTARGIAAALGRRLRDSDDDVRALAGRSGAEVADELGVAALHLLEEAALLGALAEAEPLVVAAAASVVESAMCRTALARRAVVVHLDAPPEVLVARTAAGDHRRAMSAEEMRAVHEERAVLYAQVADVAVDTTAPPDRVVTAVLDGVDGLDDAPPTPTHRVLVVAHAPMASAAALRDAVAAGVDVEGLEDVEVVVRPALAAGAADIRRADAVVVVTPVNIGYLSGGLKDFFDRTYREVRGERPGLPYGAVLKGGMDATGARRALESITTGLEWSAVADPVVVIGEVTDDHLAAARELGSTVAARLLLG